MDPGSILFVLAMLVLAGAYVARPLSQQVASGLARAHPERSRLQAQRERLLDAIQELDNDHGMGKVPPDEYQQQRRQLAIKGANVLRQLDQLSDAAPETGLEAELEAQVAELKQQLVSPGSRVSASASDEPAGHLSADQARYCPACGTAASPGDRFCTNCGTALSEQGA